ncbi:hypothetical protein TVNIR_1025 [Thioalkalivibrio nitratireducens DSM 14787]|uniref:Uncharacterized protein n=1 Tax=Thioalkalivibrio nitratireducens (strain DSM 14787 / UNIQEM 213 / ALEN2) TaxID=1255043 RepID=L0DSW9_THIND|nr:hypothetical protein TVNIR_1025 [Thioalkalivibrio nitratireducens DSM 14787]
MLAAMAREAYPCCTSDLERPKLKVQAPGSSEAAREVAQSRANA